MQQAIQENINIFGEGSIEVQTSVLKLLKICKIKKPENYNYYSKIMENSKKKLISIYILKNMQKKLNSLNFFRYFFIANEIYFFIKI